METYIWVRRCGGSFQGAKVEQMVGEGIETRYAVAYLDDCGVETGEVGSVWQQERNTAVAKFTTLEGLQKFSGGANETR